MSQNEVHREHESETLTPAEKGQRNAKGFAFLSKVLNRLRNGHSD